jgi:hypothetical protein
MVELFRAGTRGTRPGKEVLLDSHGLDTLGITFHACIPKRTRESHQAILPRGDGAFPTIQLLLLGKELLQPLDSHR